mmetsp:Transcript_107336/g.169456  ORF Transcript_107336/g.169456 Transcript_107336/m.169456 type:complete len:246 (-) Transcript_107336:2908-3645(-)
MHRHCPQCNLYNFQLCPRYSTRCRYFVAKKSGEICVELLRIVFPLDGLLQVLLAPHSWRLLPTALHGRQPKRAHWRELRIVHGATAAGGPPLAPRKGASLTQKENLMSSIPPILLNDPVVHAVIHHLAASISLQVALWHALVRQPSMPASRSRGPFPQACFELLVQQNGHALPMSQLSISPARGHHVLHAEPVPLHLALHFAKLFLMRLPSPQGSVLSCRNSARGNALRDRFRQRPHSPDIARSG